MAIFTCSRDPQWTTCVYGGQFKDLIYIQICLPMGLTAYNLNEKWWAISLTYFI